MRIERVFGCDQHNMLCFAIKECAKDWAKQNKIEIDSREHYIHKFLKNTYYTALVQLVMKKLNEEKYEIRKENNEN